MNREPCVRFGIFISPKISEKPADNRNSSPPKAILLPASSSEMFIARRSSQKGRPRRRSAGSAFCVLRGGRLFPGSRRGRRLEGRPPQDDALSYCHQRLTPP